MLNTFQEGRSHIAVVAPLRPEYRKHLEQINGDGSSHSQGSTPEKEQSWRSLFRHRSRSDASENEKDELKKAEEGTNIKGDVRERESFPVVQTSQTNLIAAMADTDYPSGIITLEDVLEGLSRNYTCLWVLSSMYLLQS